jgi:hypothetical protein
MTSATQPVILARTSSIVAGKVGKSKLPLLAYFSSNQLYSLSKL